MIQQYLRDASPVAKQLNKAGIPKRPAGARQLGTRKQLYITWIRATYIMVANRKALPYLPKGANIELLTYGQFHPVGEEHRYEDGAEAGRLPRGNQRPDPAVLPGIPRAVVQQRGRDHVGSKPRSRVGCT